MQKVYHLLRSKTGHYFSLYKNSALYRRFERKMHTLHIEDMEDFANYLQNNPNEVNTLFKELLIGVTKFFRDFEAFKFLEKKILPDLIVKKNKNEPLRIWVTACSTGEEAFSIAMLIKEVIEKGNIYHLGKVQIYATDLDADAIERARAGLYFSNIEGDISPKRIQKLVQKANKKYLLGIAINIEERKKTEKALEDYAENCRLNQLLMEAKADEMADLNELLKQSEKELKELMPIKKISLHYGS